LSLDQLSGQFRNKVAETLQILDQARGIPTSTRDQIRAHIEQINNDFIQMERNAQGEHRRHSQENAYLEQQLRDAQRQIKEVVYDRLNIANEKADLANEISKLTLKYKTSLERLREVEERYKQSNEDLLRQVQVQGEQLSGRRALWLEANPGSSARRTAMESIQRDPFHSPLANHSSSFTNAMSAMGSLSLRTPPTRPSPNTGRSGVFGPPPQMGNAPSSSSRGRRIPSTLKPALKPALKLLPAGNADPRTDIVAAIQQLQRSQPTRPFMSGGGYTPSEYGGDDQAPSTSLVLHSQNEREVADFKAGFKHLYAKVETWVTQFTSQPHSTNDHAIAASNQILWQYMMNCTYPGNRQDAHNHVVALLNNPNSRPWFVMRMTTAYLVKDVMTVDAFLGFNSDVDRIIKEVEEELKQRGMPHLSIV